METENNPMRDHSLDKQSTTIPANERERQDNTPKPVKQAAPVKPKAARLFDLTKYTPVMIAGVKPFTEKFDEFDDTKDPEILAHLVDNQGNLHHGSIRLDAWRVCKLRDLTQIYKSPGRTFVAYINKHTKEVYAIDSCVQDTYDRQTRPMGEDDVREITIEEGFDGSLHVPRKPHHVRERAAKSLLAQLHKTETDLVPGIRVGKYTITGCQQGVHGNTYTVSAPEET